MQFCLSKFQAKLKQTKQPGHFSRRVCTWRSKQLEAGRRSAQLKEHTQ
jgi:hypothetical protein